MDYYLLKETVEASMSDAIDDSMLSSLGLIRVDKEKFIESFVRRMSDNVEASRNYKVKVYDINETPPRVSVRVESQTYANFGETTTPIVTHVDAILETKTKYNGFYYKVNRKMNTDVKNIFRRVKEAKS